MLIKRKSRQGDTFISEERSRTLDRQLPPNLKRLIECVCFTLIFVYTYFLAFSTVSLVGDGASPYPLGLDSTKPYRDFFWPAPPGTVLRGELATLIGSPLYVWHWYGVLATMGFVVSVRQILKAANASFIGLILGEITAVVIFASLSLDRSGGWNTVGFALLTVALACHVSLVTNLGELSHERKILMLYGFASSWAALEKQTFIIPPILLLSLFFAHSNTRQKYEILKRLRFILIGISIPVLITLFWCLRNAIPIQNIIRMVLSGESKGDITFTSVLLNYSRIVYQSITAGDALLFALITLGLIYSPSHQSKPFAFSSSAETVSSDSTAFNTNTQNSGKLFGFIASLIGILLISTSIKSTPGLTPFFGLFVCSVLALAITSWKHRSTLSHRAYSKALIFVPISFYLVSSILNSTTLVSAIRIHEVLTRWIIVLAIFFLYIAIFHKDLETPNTRVLFLTSVFSMSTLLIGSLSGPPISWLFACMISVVFGIAISELSFARAGTSSVNQKVTQLHAVLGISLILFVITIDTLDVPFRWWSWQSSSLVGELQSPSIDYLDGFRLPKAEIEFFEALNEGIQEARGDHDGKILGFPNLMLTTNMSGMSPLVLSCTNLFWDLCPDEYALLSLDELIQNEHLLRVVVWLDMPDTARSAHEDLYRGGEPAALRQWDEYRDAQVSNGSWIPIRKFATLGVDANTIGQLTVYRVISAEETE